MDKNQPIGKAGLIINIQLDPVANISDLGKGPCRVKGYIAFLFKALHAIFKPLTTDYIKVYYGIRPIFCGWSWCTERLRGWLVFYFRTL